MSLIFDSFPDRKHAEDFSAAVKEQFPQHQTHIWMSQHDMQELCMRQGPGGNATPEEMNIEADVFPWKLEPPIVLVSRLKDGEHEHEIEQLVKTFGGVFAGT